MAISEKDFQDIKKKIANFVKEELLDNEKQFQPKHTFADHLPYLEEKRNQVREMGLFTPQIPKEYGGLGLSLHQLGQIYEILAGTFYGLYVFSPGSLLCGDVWCYGHSGATTNSNPA